MSDPMKAKGIIVVDDWVDESVLGAWRFLTWEDLVSVVREGVESGTIKGEVVDCSTCYGDGAVPEEAPRGSGLDCMAVPCPTCGGTGQLLRIPVSDGGSET